MAPLLPAVPCEGPWKLTWHVVSCRGEGRECAGWKDSPKKSHVCIPKMREDTVIPCKDVGMHAIIKWYTNLHADLFQHFSATAAMAVARWEAVRMPRALLGALRQTLGSDTKERTWCDEMGMKYIENDFSNKLEGDTEITWDKDSGWKPNSSICTVRVNFCSPCNLQTCPSKCVTAIIFNLSLQTVNQWNLKEKCVKRCENARPPPGVPSSPRSVGSLCRNAGSCGSRGARWREPGPWWNAWQWPPVPGTGARGPRQMWQKKVGWKLMKMERDGRIIITNIINK